MINERFSCHPHYWERKTRYLFFPQILLQHKGVAMWSFLVCWFCGSVTILWLKVGGHTILSQKDLKVWSYYVERDVWSSPIPLLFHLSTANLYELSGAIAIILSLWGDTPENEVGTLRWQRLNPWRVMWYLLTCRFFLTWHDNLVGVLATCC